METTNYTFGDVPLQTAQSGNWEISPFEISEQEAGFHNLRCQVNRRFMHMIKAGRYMRLQHRNRGIVMTNTPMEVSSNRAAYRSARGHVLINGLGLGMLLDGVLRKPEVESVRVIEIDEDVINLVAPRFADNPKFQVVHADAFQYRPQKGEVFDYVWHDIWDDICLDNKKQMNKLVARYRKPRALAQGVWSKDMLGEIAHSGRGF